MRIILMGDSTMQYNDATTYPQVGWGQMLTLFFNNKVKIYNFAKNGCSTKSFVDLGIFNRAIEKINKGSYCFIQFGHNDEKFDNPLRYTNKDTTYQDNLRMYINEVKKRGGTPILLTSIYRRFFDDNHVIQDDVHIGYPEAMIKVGLEENVLCLDICSKTKKLLSDLGDEKSKELFMIFEKNKYQNYPEGMFDNTHLRSDGAYAVAKVVSDSLIEIKHPLTRYLVKKSK